MTMTDAVPPGARAFPLQYEITMPLDPDELVWSDKQIATLTMTGSRHLGKWLLGFLTPGNRPRRILEVRTLNRGDASADQAYATAGAALGAECERLGLVLGGGVDRTDERERVPGETAAQAETLVVGRFVLDGRPARQVADDFAMLVRLIDGPCGAGDYQAAALAVLDAGFRLLPGGTDGDLELFELIGRNHVRGEQTTAFAPAAVVLEAGWTRGDELQHDQQRRDRIAEVLLDAIG